MSEQERALRLAQRIQKNHKLWLQKSSQKLRESLAVDNPVPSDVAARTRQVEECLKMWEDSTWELERLVSDDNVDDFIEESFSFKDQVMLLVSKSETFFNSQTPLITPKSESICSNSTSGSSCHKTKLPDQTMPRFEKDITEWYPFWEQFKSLVDDDPNLTPVAKFNYLKGTLDGEAARVIKGFSTTEANYSKAVEKLQERFGRKDIIIQTHLQSLLKLDVATKCQPGSSGYISSLWNFYDDVDAHVRSIEALGIEISKCETFLVPIILSRIPNTMTQAWFKLKSTHTREDDLELLLKFIYDHISNLDSAEMYRPKSDKVKEKTADSTASSLLNPSTPSNTSVCKYCKKPGHYINSCFKFKELDVELRIKKRRDLRLCVKCLRNMHKGNCSYRCSKCLGEHHDLLHRVRKVSNASPDSGKTGNPVTDANPVQLSPSAETFTPKVEKTSESFTGVNQCQLAKDTVTVLQTAKVQVKVNQTLFDATVLFDTGSDKSYVSSKFSSKIKPHLIGRETISYSAFGENHSSKSCLSKLFSLDIIGVDKCLHKLNVLEVPNICKTLFRQRVPLEVVQSFDVHFSDNYQHDRNLNVDILIGMDYYWEFVSPTNFIKKQGLLAMSTVVGWFLSGSFSVNAINFPRTAQLLCIGATPPEIERFWSLESFGIGPELSERKNLKSSQVYSNFSECIENIGNRYQVPLVFKKDFSPDQIVDNKVIALKRLEQTYKSLNKNPELRDQYHNIFFDYEKDDIIEEVPKGRSVGAPYQPYYLPHRPILKLTSVSTKIRPVFDGSCKSFNGLSVNELLDEGPSLNPNIVSILLRFRRWLVALLADVKMAFLQISLHPYFRDICRFLLRIGDTIRVMRFKRIPFGLRCSPFILNATLKHHLGFYGSSDAVREMDENM